jgi:4-aminobutyrate aminotransferase-like enzyme
LIELSPYKFDGPGGKGKAPYIHKVMIPDTYRGPYKASDQRAGEKYAKYAQESIKEIKNDKKRISAFVYESLPGCAGQIVLPDGYLKAVFTYVHDAGGICIADEVQVGFGQWSSYGGCYYHTRDCGVFR